MHFIVSKLSKILQGEEQGIEVAHLKAVGKEESTQFKERAVPDTGEKYRSVFQRNITKNGKKNPEYNKNILKH